VESIADHLKTLMDQRAVHVAEMEGHASAIDAIDAELHDARSVLGIVDKDAGLLGAVIAYLSTHGPTRFDVIREQMGRSRHSILSAVRRANGRIVLEGNTTRRLLRLLTDDRPAPAYVEPAAKARPLATRTEDVQCQRPGCGVIFRPGGGTSGLYCSRACYDDVRSAKRRQPMPARVATPAAPEPEPSASPTPEPLPPHLQDAVEKLNTSHNKHGLTHEDIAPDPPPAVISTFPERRCGRCLLKFRPTKDREYVCPLCVDKPKVKPAPPVNEEYEVVASGRDFPTGGNGSSLAAETKVHI
jgi:hypothetical protein